jgi:hypothetical protein
MSNSLVAGSSYRPARRSTRINQAVALTVQGVDSFRAPYSEQVSTLTLNCHGCKYTSKYEVLPSSWVTLELNDHQENSEPTSVRGRVKWVKRAAETGNGLFQTAVELDSPGNVWGINSPPADWLPFCLPQTIEIDPPKAKPFAVPKPDPSPAHDAKQTKPAVAPERKSAAPVPSAVSAKEPRSGALMGEFQHQMEAMLAQAAQSAVREHAASALEELRAGIREESSRILAERMTSEAVPWIERTIEQMKQAGRENARLLHAQWTKKIEADVQEATRRIEMRHRELEELSSSLASNTLDRVQEVLEASRKDAVDRIVARLKEQVTPQIEHARKVTAEISSRTAEMETLLDESIETFSGRIEKSCASLEKQFEQILRERMDAAREMVDRAVTERADLALQQLHASAERHDGEAQARLQAGLERVAEEALAGFVQKVAETSRQFAGELGDYSRSHLEYVGSAISDLARGIGKPPKE